MSALPPTPALSPPRPVGDENEWAERLLEAFGTEKPANGFLPLAESAVATWPGEPVILQLAATAALLDARPGRALAFLKRVTKRYRPNAIIHLLSALSLFKLNKRIAARALLEEHGLTNSYGAARIFPAGDSHTRWVMGVVDAIMGRDGRRSGERRP